MTGPRAGAGRTVRHVPAGGSPPARDPHRPAADGGTPAARPGHRAGAAPHDRVAAIIRAAPLAAALATPPPAPDRAAAPRPRRPGT